MFGTFRLVMVIALIGSLAGAGFYVNKLRSDNAILKANQIKLESAVEDQKAVIQDQKISYEKILDANKKLNITISTQKRELDDLNQRFNKNNRDIGKLAVDKTKIIEKILFLLRTSLKKIYPNITLRIGIIKYPKLASIIRFVAIA